MQRAEPAQALQVQERRRQQPVVLPLGDPDHLMDLGVVGTADQGQVVHDLRVGPLGQVEQHV